MGLPWPAGFTCNWKLNARVLPQEWEAPLRWGHSGMAGFQRRDSQLSRQPACLSISITNSCANRFGAAATSGSIDSAVAICQFYLHGGLSVFEHLLCCLGSAAWPGRLLPLSDAKDASSAISRFSGNHAGRDRRWISREELVPSFRAKLRDLNSGQSQARLAETKE